MSIVAMTSAAVGYRTHNDLGQAPPSVPTAQARGAQDNSSTLNDALQAITAYIPSEVLVTYVAVSAAINASPSSSHTGEWVAFWSFLVATPLAVWLLFAAKLRNGGKPLPWTPGTWPLWEFIAATLSYAIWAYTLPKSPFSYVSWYDATVGSVLILVSAFALGLLAPVFQPRGATS